MYFGEKKEMDLFFLLEKRKKRRASQDLNQGFLDVSQMLLLTEPLELCHWSSGIGAEERCIHTRFESQARSQVASFSDLPRPGNEAGSQVASFPDLPRPGNEAGSQVASFPDLPRPGNEAGSQVLYSA